jgi:hypothetical protein
MGMDVKYSIETSSRGVYNYSEFQAQQTFPYGNGNGYGYGFLTLTLMRGSMIATPQLPPQKNSNTKYNFNLIDANKTQIRTLLHISPYDIYDYLL